MSKNLLRRFYIFYIYSIWDSSLTYTFDKPILFFLFMMQEVAIDIVQKKEADEASSIFIDGLKPVVAIKEMEVVISDANSYHNIDVSKEKTQILEASCQCSSAAIMDSPDQSRVKEPLSSPF